MAIGTITINNQGARGPLTNIKMLILTFPPDAAYPTGGTLAFRTSVLAAFETAYGASDNMTILGVIPLDTGNNHVEYLAATGALKVYDPNGAEYANATDLTAVKATFKVMVIGE